MRELDLRFGMKGVIIRNDNGSQFIAHAVRQTLKDLEAKQEFTHVATPEENAYIESFHSIQQRELFDRFEFSSYYHAKEHLGKYMYWYNFIRRHGALNFQTPMHKWAQGESCSAVRRSIQRTLRGLSRSADSYEMFINNQPLVNNLDNLDEVRYLCLTGEQEKGGLVLNCFENNVQIIGC